MSLNQKPVLRGSCLLSKISITVNVPDCPGVYLLIKSDGFNAVYVGRSDNLMQTLLCHIPKNEKTVNIKEMSPDLFLYQATNDLESAFDLECRWYHMFKPLCNKEHPLFHSKNKHCPVCQLKSDININ